MEVELNFWIRNKRKSDSEKQTSVYRKSTRLESETRAKRATKPLLCSKETTLKAEHDVTVFRSRDQRYFCY